VKFFHISVRKLFRFDWNYQENTQILLQFQLIMDTKTTGIKYAYSQAKCLVARN